MQLSSNSATYPHHYLSVAGSIQLNSPLEPERRAYQNQNGKFVFITATNDLRRDENPSLSDLKSKAMLTMPVTGEFGFLAWARVNPQSPPAIALRLFTFDGQQFRTRWSSPDFRTVAYPFDNVVEVTSTGFVVTSAVDSTGGAAHPPDVIIHEQFALSVNGPVKVTESRSRRE